MIKWVDIVAKSSPLLRVADRLVMIDDNIKISKEATKMPGLSRKKLTIEQYQFIKEQQK
jgi:hypothetical protein